MKLSEIKEVKYAVTQNEVNQFLNEGYEILRIYSTKIKYPEIEEIKPLIMMAKQKIPILTVQTRAKRKGVEIIG